MLNLPLQFEYTISELLGFGTAGPVSQPPVDSIHEFGPAWIG